MPANDTAAVNHRRRQVADLWLRGASAGSIAAALHTSESTVRRDLEVIRDELASINRDALEMSRNRTLAVYRLVQQHAWTLYNHVDERSTNRVGALNTILAAEDRIARITGVLGPDHVNLTAIAVRVERDAIQRAAEDPTIANLTSELLARIAGPGDGQSGGPGMGGE